jgi:hypothetical protein
MVKDTAKYSESARSCECSTTTIIPVGGCGRFPGLDYAANPVPVRYSTGLIAREDISVEVEFRPIYTPEI